MPTSRRASCSPCSISREDIESTESASAGCASHSGLVSSDVTGSAVGIAPTRSRPASPSRIAPRSPRIPSTSVRILWTHESIRVPSGVRPSKRRPRSTSGTPSSCSRRWMPAESVGCETPQVGGRAPEVALACECGQVGELLQQHG